MKIKGWKGIKVITVEASHNKAARHKGLSIAVLCNI
jgi:hypothetical protein